ncbi:MAG: threonine aldolase family protein [Acidimicrobiales bacterium]
MTELVELTTLAKSCTRFLQGHGPRTAADFLDEIPADTELDRYGDGGVVSALEQRVARLLGKQAAVFCVTGTMAQQMTLRVHADRRSRGGVVFHPACHLDWREGRGYERLHHLSGLQAGEIGRPLELGDLEALGEPPAVLLLELPQRDLGGHLPQWAELEELVAWARAKGAAVHMDGARLWEAQPFYDKSLEEIASLFDSVYVSFYKGLGALAGCCVAGDTSTVKEVREWRRRHGGTLFSMWPNAASAMAGLDRRLPRMPEYFAHAKAIAAVLAGLGAVDMLPDSRAGALMAPMMHLFLPASREQWERRFRQLALEEGICTWPQPWPPSGHPAVQRVEFTIGDATMLFSPQEIGRIVAHMADG